jgi:hypothetical protein
MDGRESERKAERRESMKRIKYFKKDYGRRRYEK